MLDENLNWLYLLKSKTKVRPNLSDTEFLVNGKLEHERKSLFKQWNRIVIFHDNLFREYTDKNEQSHYQYIVPKH